MRSEALRVAGCRAESCRAERAGAPVIGRLDVAASTLAPLRVVQINATSSQDPRFHYGQLTGTTWSADSAIRRRSKGGRPHRNGNENSLCWPAINLELHLFQQPAEEEEAAEQARHSPVALFGPHLNARC